MICARKAMCLFSCKHILSHRVPSSFFSFKGSVTAAASNIQNLTPIQKEQISAYAGALLQWNRRMNLTAVTEEAEVMTRHVDDSLSLIPPLKRSYLSRCRGTVVDCDDDDDDVRLSLVDVGSGAGLPGLIFAIACPRQNAGQCPDFRETFDVAVARAVAEMRILAEYCIPLVRVGGMFIAAKGHDPQ